MIVLILGIVCIITCIVEALFMFTLFYPKKWIKGSIVCNLITNPALNMIYPAIDYSFRAILVTAGMDFALARFLSYTVLVGLEIGIVFLEAWIYSFFVTDETYKTRLAVSAKANAVSFIFGILISSITLCSCRLPYYA